MDKTTQTDLYFMKKAIALAWRGSGNVHPNPMVGAILVKKNRVLGQGFHARFGGAHAEVNAIRGAKGRAAGGTLYVTLEPCAHFGKTPPCVDLIIESKIREVVVGALDPNPLVSGKGLRRLKKAGIRVRTGILKTACEDLNRDYDHWIRKRMPYVTVKVAQSLDGKIATKTGESRWISSEASRRFSQRLRAESDAILVGVNTVLKDDPRLSVRGLKNVRQPLKVILDSRLRISLNARIFSKASAGPVMVAVTQKANRAKRDALRGKAEVVVVKEKKGKIDLRALLSELAKRGVLRVLIEGGGEVIGGAFSEKLVQEIYFFIAPIIIGGEEAVSSVAGKGIMRLAEALKIREAKVELIDGDILVHGRL